MKLIIQRAKNAQVKVHEEVVGKIDNGFVVLLGVGPDDTTENADFLIKKLTNLRVFTDDEYKMNLNLKDVNGQLLIISQFTLYADCKKGNRPSFVNAAPPKLAEELYNYFVEECKKLGIKTETGVFGAHMEVSLINDGPVTILLEK